MNKIEIYKLKMLQSARRIMLIIRKKTGRSLEDFYEKDMGLSNEDVKKLKDE